LVAKREVEVEVNQSPSHTVLKIGEKPPIEDRSLNPESRGRGRRRDERKKEANVEDRTGKHFSERLKGRERGARGTTRRRWRRRRRRG
jgi:hypothetical protein